MTLRIYAREAVPGRWEVGWRLVADIAPELPEREFATRVETDMPRQRAFDLVGRFRAGAELLLLDWELDSIAEELLAGS